MLGQLDASSNNVESEKGPIRAELLPHTEWLFEASNRTRSWSSNLTAVSEPTPGNIVNMTTTPSQSDLNIRLWKPQTLTENNYISLNIF